MRNKLSRKGHLYDNEDIKLPLDNINLVRSNMDEKVFILISSPLEDLNINMINEFKNYPYDIYVIHPNFLDYYAFIGKDSRLLENFNNESIEEALKHPLEKINYAFTNAKPSQIQDINEKIYLFHYHAACLSDHGSTGEL